LGQNRDTIGGKTEVGDVLEIVTYWISEKRKDLLCRRDAEGAKKN
jgi:hypothetical protein